MILENLFTPFLLTLCLLKNSLILQSQLRCYLHQHPQVVAESSRTQQSMVLAPSQYLPSSTRLFVEVRHLPDALRYSPVVATWINVIQKNARQMFGE